MNTPVKFELAKLLDEKGFDKPCQFLRVAGKFRINYENEGDLFNNAFPSTQKPNDWFLAPTIAEVVMWLYEKYGIWMNGSPVFEFNSGRNDYLTIRGFQYYITVITDNKYNQEKSHAGREYKNSPTEAYEAAIEYILNNLL